MTDSLHYLRALAAENDRLRALLARAREGLKLYAATNERLTEAHDQDRGTWLLGDLSEAEELLDYAALQSASVLAEIEAELGHKDNEAAPSQGGGDG